VKTPIISFNAPILHLPCFALKFDLVCGSLNFLEKARSEQMVYWHFRHTLKLNAKHKSILNIECVHNVCRINPKLLFFIVRLIKYYSSLTSDDDDEFPLNNPFLFHSITQQISLSRYSSYHPSLSLSPVIPTCKKNLSIHASILQPVISYNFYVYTYTQLHETNHHL